MRYYIPTQEDWDLVNNHNVSLHIKIQELTKDFIPLGEITGDIVQGTISIDAESEVRRTASINFLSDDSLITDKMSYFRKIFIGMSSPIHKDVKWYECGIFIVDTETCNESATDKSYSVSYLDMVCMLDGTHDGAMIGVNTLTIEADYVITDAIIALIADERFGNLTKYIVDEIGMYSCLTGREGYQDSRGNNPEWNLVPYDLEMSAGSTVYDVIVKARDLYPSYESFFMPDGTFVIQMIPTLVDEDCVMYKDDFIGKVIDEDISRNNSEIKNMVEVWGKSIDVDRFSDMTKDSGCYTDTKNGIYHITLDKYESYVDGQIIGIKVTSNNTDNMKIQINNLDTIDIKEIYSENGVIEGHSLVKDTLLSNYTYCFKYVYESDISHYFEYLGSFQIHGIAKLVSSEPTKVERNIDIKKYDCENIFYMVNPLSPYTIDKIGERKMVCQGDTYENITSDKVALYNAQYEVWKNTNIKDSVTITTRLIPWLDVNQKVEYTNRKGETYQYIIKSINMDISTNTMSISMIRFYPLYTDIISE